MILLRRRRIARPRKCRSDECTHLSDLALWHCKMPGPLRNAQACVSRLSLCPAPALYAGAVPFRFCSSQPSSGLLVHRRWEWPMQASLSADVLHLSLCPVSTELSIFLTKLHATGCLFSPPAGSGLPAAVLGARVGFLQQRRRLDQGQQGRPGGAVLKGCL